MHGGNHLGLLAFIGALMHVAIRIVGVAAR
jgi:hypothetical protein